MKKLIIVLVACLSSLLSLSAETIYHKVVAKDGTGDYTTIQEAINAVWVYQDQRTIIEVKNGTYHEKVVVPASMVNVSLIGESCEGTIITYADNANIDQMGTFRSYSFLVHGDGFRAENLTIENASQIQGQAVALHLEGTESIFLNCRILGNQDTLFTGNAYGRFYFQDCYIEGTTDFIFGPATAWFERCAIHSKMDSYITAASTPAKNPFGYIFSQCKLTAEPGIKVYLGRPWREFAYTLFMHCHMDGHIRSEGWNIWDKQGKEEGIRYLEYNNTGEGSMTTNRVRWSRVLSDAEAGRITLKAVFPDISQWSAFHLSE